METKKEVVFQVFEDGTFSIRSSDLDMEEIGQMVFNIIYKLVRSPAVLSAESIHARRQAALEAYRKEYEMNHHHHTHHRESQKCHAAGEDEIDG